MKDPEGVALRRVLVDLFGEPIDKPLDDRRFNDIALRAFAYQFARNAPYAAFCERRERTPQTVAEWTQIPAVPTAAFKEVQLVAGSVANAEVTFRTSGTTQGSEKRGSHHVLDVAIYHFSLIPNFASCVLPDGAELQLLSLVPPSSEVPDSSLSHMVDVVLDRLGSRDSACFASATHGIADGPLAAELRSAEEGGRPVCLLGTSFAFVHWLDRIAARNERFALPEGSRLMDTGGYKGRSREVAEADMRGLYQDLLGIPPSHCVNEYGMTEMCSQFYDSVLRDAVHARRRAEGPPAADTAEGRRKIVPPWVRTRVVDPETLAPLPHGERGLLQHFDLANVASVSAIQTEDLGIMREAGFTLLGRAPDATPRGCSIAMDMLLEAVVARRR
jgi:hypothetical protein